MRNPPSWCTRCTLSGRGWCDDHVHLMDAECWCLGLEDRKCICGNLLTNTGYHSLNCPQHPEHATHADQS